MPGLRETLEEAYDEADAAPVADAPVEAVEPAPEAQVEETAQEASDRARDEQGRFAKATADAAQAAPAVAAAVAPAAPVVAPKVPHSWKAHERELAAKLPPEFRPILDAALRRELETSAAMKKSAEASQSAQGFQEALRPYEALVRASGLPPQQYVGNLLQTAHALSYGAPHQKAGLLADIIMQFGVAPADLDQALVARMNGHQVPQGQQQQFRDPRVDQLMQQLESAKRERTTAQAAEADSTAGSFADTHEFFDDVAEDVADLLDVWAKKGKREVTGEDLERAYTIACQTNPDVSTVFSQRKALEAAKSAQAGVQRAKLASSSVRSQPTAASAAQPTGRRAALESAYDELDR